MQTVATRMCISTARASKWPPPNPPCVRFCSNCQTQISWKLHEDLTSTCEACAHSLAPPGTPQDAQADRFALSWNRAGGPKFCWLQQPSVGLGWCCVSEGLGRVSTHLSGSRRSLTAAKHQHEMLSTVAINLGEIRRSWASLEPTFSRLILSGILNTVLSGLRRLDYFFMNKIFLLLRSVRCDEAFLSSD